MSETLWDKVTNGKRVILTVDVTVLRVEIRSKRGKFVFKHDPSYGRGFIGVIDPNQTNVGRYSDEWAIVFVGIFGWGDLREMSDTEYTTTLARRLKEPEVQEFYTEWKRGRGLVEAASRETKGEVRTDGAARTTKPKEETQDPGPRLRSIS